ncbi:MAG: hypothetical protein JSS99_16975 [Actinobacteria bacterium]|nr:hypothetical protein [Actinomycetota bacterium]
MTNRLLRLPLLLAAALLAALTLVACGGTGEPPTTHGDGEGSYIQAGPLIYQVQMSRELNPANVEDAEYLQGLSAGAPAQGEEWFGVWLRVQNDTKLAHVSASSFKIVDTTGAEYTPIALPATNPFAYRPVSVRSNDVFQPVQPDPESAAGTGPINGTMLLFKLRTNVYANRPLELEIAPPGGGSPSSVVLDL